MAAEPDLIDWTIAARIGRRVAGGRQLEVVDAWTRAFNDYSARADLAVAEYTGLGGDLPAPVALALDRGQWIEANLSTLQALLLPVARRVATRRPWSSNGGAATLMRNSTRAIAGVQAGGLLGIVGQRVLGQYNLPLTNTNGDGEGVVFYVVPNIVGAERRFGFRPPDFRLWIALHELAHRRQFRGIPWLAGYVSGMVDEYLTTVDLDEESLQALGGRAVEVARNLRTGQQVDLLDVLVAPEQRDLVRRLQAVMSVLEGHGELVMGELGATMIPGQARMHATLRERRRSGGRGERLLQQLMGLRQKLDQYAQGERFLRTLLGRGGMALVNRVFDAPEMLPTLDEVRDPERWLARAG